MIFFIKYSYKKEHPEFPKADSSFHFVECDTKQQALAKAKEYIHNLLYYRFGEEVEFEINTIEVLE